MTPRFLFHPAARTELLEAREWYEAQRSGLGAEFAQVVDQAMGRIAEHPELYPEIDKGVRRAVLPRFPYGVIYRIKRQSIQIIAVFHHRRDPLVWRRRDAIS